jgi:hypothetical protein
MAVEFTINVGFHSNLGCFKQNAIRKFLFLCEVSQKLAFNPTYGLKTYGRCWGSAVNIV